MLAPTWPYDALLLVSFGGPERAEDVLPFLRRVTAGKDVPDERLEVVAEHYHAFGGRSPINDQNRELLKAIEQDLASSGIDLPVYWGNRNWDPTLEEVMAQMRADGIERAAAFVTSAYSSYSGCRQYRENLADAQDGGLPRIDKLRHYFNHPRFVDVMVDATLAALAELPGEARHGGHVLFVTHSIPDAMNEASGPSGKAYFVQHRSVAVEVINRVRDETGHSYPSHLVFCSRSGSPRTPWMEPDVNDQLRALHERGVPGAVIVPIGFVSDHMEVVNDLDVEALGTARELGMPCKRAATAGIDPRFVSMVRELVLERAAAERGDTPERPAVGWLPPSWDLCEPGCCANPAGDRPTVSSAG